MIEITQISKNLMMMGTVASYPIQVAFFLVGYDIRFGVSPELWRMSPIFFCSAVHDFLVRCRIRRYVSYSRKLIILIHTLRRKTTLTLWTNFERLRDDYLTRYLVRRRSDETGHSVCSALRSRNPCSDSNNCRITFFTTQLICSAFVKASSECSGSKESIRDWTNLESGLQDIRGSILQSTKVSV